MSALSGLKPGDQIVVSFGWNEMSVRTVVKVTKLHFVDDGGDRWRSDGTRTGDDSCSRVYAEPATDDALTRYAEVRDRNRLEKHLRHTLSPRRLRIEDVRAILAVTGPIVKRLRADADREKVMTGGAG